MFHTELFSSSIASGANTFAQVTYVSTGAVLPALNNGMLVVNDLAFLSHLMHVGAHAVHCRPQSNSMLPFPYLSVSPNNRGTAFESPPRTLDLSLTPWPLRPAEEFDVFATQNAGAGEVQYVGVNFADGPPTPLAFALMPAFTHGQNIQPGRAFTAHTTGSTTLTAGGWTQVSITFDQTLPPGLYGVIGMRAFSATALFARIKPVQNTNRRPGGIGVQAYDQLDPWWQRAWPWGGKVVAPMGIWAQFYQNVPPFIEFFATSADTAEEVWLDMVFLSATPMPGV